MRMRVIHTYKTYSLIFLVATAEEELRTRENFLDLSEIDPGRWKGQYDVCNLQAFSLNLRRLYECR